MLVLLTILPCLVWSLNVVSAIQIRNSAVGKDRGTSRLVFVPSVLSAAERTAGKANSPAPVPICIVGKPCGDTGTGTEQCCCHNGTAVCANQGLHRIPTFPNTITTLDFSNNSLKGIDSSTLRNLTSLVVLNLEKNEIHRIHADAFVGMKRLQDIRLSGNHLRDLHSLLSSLEHARHLQCLNASRNHFQHLNLSDLSFTPNLKTMSLNGNRINKITHKALRGVHQLEMLDLSDNLLSSFPDLCRVTDGEAYLPFLHTLSLEWNIITIINLNSSSSSCLPGLKSLKLSGNAIHHIRKNFLQGIPSLESLSLQFCMSKSIDRHAFNHTNLKHLDISENLWFFDSHFGSGINHGLFQHMPQLHFINMSWTVFRYSATQERDAVLSSLKHVKEFSLAGTGLSMIPATILAEFTNLTSLTFAKNDISFLDDNTFENLTSLTSLDLNENHLTSVSEQLLTAIINRPNARVDLSENPFSCTCDLLWFVQTFQTDVRRAQDHYKCKSPDSKRNTMLAVVDITHQTCMINYNIYIAILFVCIVLILLLVVFSVVYKFRWQIRFLVYTLQHRWSSSRPSGPVPVPVYDIFVSYDSDDSHWVLGVLQPKLEQQRGLKLCLHERDFLPGMFISQNIIEKMEESGAVMPVFSNAFLHSDWCRFELFMAVKTGLQRRACPAQRRVAVLPVLLEELQLDHVDSLLMAVLNSTTYLAWPRQGTEEERERFWNTLCSVLTRSQSGGQREMLSL